MTTNIIDKDGKSIDASTATVPSDRHFRNAWTLDGKVITEDLTESKKIFQDKIREVRKELLEAQDVAFMKALEAGDSDAQTTAKNAKTALRDAPASSAITNAKTIAELKQGQVARMLRLLIHLLTYLMVVMLHRIQCSHCLKCFVILMELHQEQQ
jgi:uncharacterized Fe-S center protein